MSKSVKRVEKAARDAGLNVKVEWMDDSARTAADAARTCNCDVSQIMKSLIFEGEESGQLKLLLVSGGHDVDLSRAPELFGEPLKRADPKRVRLETGFAIGGVSPIGHLNAIDTWMDTSLLRFNRVWAAAGAPKTIFSTAPSDILNVTQAKLFDLG